MKVLYVYAHPEPKSFNSALKDIALDTRKRQGMK
jgi:NAD(P)H dehydrogenase (quinone)